MDIQTLFRLEKANRRWSQAGGTGLAGWGEGAGA